ncbi:OmpH family outer membrane protein [Parendozoicomonas haliclonae]|uniref:Chaperone protein Skp n=2 Tax=Parendozoicomonas haliclonae TaxID=1960125 RepID=A0A1X7AJW5_9GAMM|nr:Chaperone protein Skp precursor [Parendozoicomonas haliclonae]
MKTGLKAAVVALALAAPLSHAAGMAVVNMQKALAESAPAKAFMKKSQEKFSTQRNNLKKLEDEIRTSITNYERDAATMSEAERSKVQVEIRRKQEDYQYQGRALEQEMAQAEQAELSRLGPKLQQAIASVAEQGGYEVVVDARTVSYVKPGLDVTAKVIEKLNTLAK